MKKIVLLLLAIIFMPFVVNAETKYLYDVLKNEAESGGLAREYIGEHHDSFVEEPSKKIYHWYANNAEEGNQILEKNNVIFADYCWKMIRTTDTGGIKLLYNGKVDFDKIPIEKEQYSIITNSGFVWNDMDGTWDIIITDGQNKEISFSIKGNKDFYFVMTGTTGNSTGGSYTLLKDNNQIYINGGGGGQSFDYNNHFESLNENNVIKFIYQGSSTQESPITFKIKMGIRGNMISDGCNNKYEDTLIGTSPFNSNGNSVAYVGYMYNPHTLVISDNNSFTYPPNNALFGNSVVYSNNKYRLVETATTFDNNHRYFCSDYSSECKNVLYYYQRHIIGGSKRVYYIELKNGKNITDAFYDMLKSNNVNQSSSTIKNYIESWYYQNLNSFSDKIEDTIFCNNRKYEDLGGWNPNGGTGVTLNAYLYFENNTINNDLSCKNITDQFSINNSLAKLNYKIGLITSSEMNLLNNPKARGNESDYWFMDPAYYSNVATMNKSSRYFDYNTYSANYDSGVRPSISLVPNSTYIKGDGTSNNPYLVGKLNQSNIIFQNDGTKGSLNINNTENVEEGTDVKFSININKGYELKKVEIKDIKGNEIDYQLINNNYVFQMPYCDVIITPIYEKVKKSINVEIVDETKDLNINIEDLTQVGYEEEVIFKVTPIKGYKVNSIRIIDKDNNEIDYSETENKNEFSFTMPASDVTIIPSYKRVSNTVNVEDNKNTKEIVIEVENITAVVYEDKVKFTVIPEDGYEIDTIEIIDENNNKIDYKKTNKDNEYEFIMPDTNVIIKPIYKKIESNISDALNNPYTGDKLYLIVLFIVIGIGLITFICKRKEARYKV